VEIGEMSLLVGREDDKSFGIDHSGLGADVGAAIWMRVSRRPDKLSPEGAQKLPKRNPQPQFVSSCATIKENATIFIECISMASSSGSYFPSRHNGNSSSSRSPPQPAVAEDESDNDDPLVNQSREQAVLADDPLGDGAPNLVSFKRKQKQPASSRFLSAFSSSGSVSRQNTPSPGGSTPSPGNGRAYPLNAPVGKGSPHSPPGAKDGGPLDWYVEGPGRRVGYEDMTAIDWIFEYTKERQRLRILYSSATGLIGYVRQILDASQIWVVLVLTGVATGVFAAGIDVVTDWLADLKTGYCMAGEDGGHFYLNKLFCCFGYDSITQCRDWVPWSLALHITSTGGKWFIEYFFFILFSVSLDTGRLIQLY
jgi:chloride channel 3/4/5